MSRRRCPILSYACDTHYPWQEADEEVIQGGKLSIRNGCVSITQVPGLGVELDHTQLSCMSSSCIAASARATMRARCASIKLTGRRSSHASDRR
jgi:hypothetical protein